MASQAGAPLLARQDDDDDFDDDFDFEETPLDEPNAPMSEGGKKPAGGLGYFVWLLTVSACISGLLFGCMCSLSHPPSPSFPALRCELTHSPLSCRRHGRHIRNARLDRHLAVRSRADPRRQVYHHVLDLALRPARIPAVLDPRRSPRPEARDSGRRRPFRAWRPGPGAGRLRVAHGPRPLDRGPRHRRGQLRDAAVSRRVGAGRASGHGGYDECLVYHLGSSRRIRYRLDNCRAW